MLERIDKLVFYYTVDCANCHNILKVSHVVVDELKGSVVCSLCGKIVNVPKWEDLVQASKILDAYLGDSLNAKFVKLVMNEKFKIQEQQLAAH